MNSLIKRAGAEAVVQSHLGDFLQADPADPQFAAVTHILCDPSCSGSGMVNRHDQALEALEDGQGERERGKRQLNDDGKRLAKLVCG